MVDDTGNSRRKFLKTAAVGAASVPFVGTVTADEKKGKSVASGSGDEKEKQREKVSSFSLHGSGTGQMFGDTVTGKDRERVRKLMAEVGEADSAPSFTQTVKKPDGTVEKLESANLLQQDPTSTPGREVWSADHSDTAETITGANLVEADFFLSAYTTDVTDGNGNRYFMLYFWGGLRPQDETLWTGNLEYADIDLELTSSNGNLVRYKPGGDRNKHGTPMDMGIEVSGEPAGVGGSASLSGQFTLGGGTVRPHRSKMDMSADNYCVAFQGDTEATCELLGMCLGKYEPGGGRVEWRYTWDVDGDRYNKCPVVC